MTIKQKSLLVSVLLIIAALSVFFIFSNKLKDALTVDNSKISTSTVAERAVTNYTKAQATTKISECRALGKEFYYCASKFLAQMKNIADCESLEDQEIKLICLSNFKLASAIDSKDAKECYKLDQKYQTSCFDTAFSTIKNINKCDELNAPEATRCRDILNYHEALSTDASVKCEIILNEGLRNNCISTKGLAPLDSDKDGLSDNSEMSINTDPFLGDTDTDGLSDSEEVKIYRTSPIKKDTDGDNLSDKNETVLGTNPKKIDTDADGFNDGDEVAKNYNPCGEGKMFEISEQKIACAKYIK